MTNGGGWRHAGPGTLVATALLALGCGDSPDETKLAPRNAGINVLLLTVDTLRADHLSTYGYPRPTSPNVDRLAANGVTFETAFTYWPKTRTSFASMFTSLHAAQHGLTVRDRDLPAFNRTLAETLEDAGYRTAAAVDNGNLDEIFGFAQGFQRYLQTWSDGGETELERTETITSFAEEFLASGGDERPFFLWLHYVNPHTPYEPPEELLDRFRDDGVVPRGPVLESVVGFHGGVNRHLEIEGARWGDYVDRYDAEILLADTHIGRVLDALETSGHAGETVVLFTSDHGESLGEHDYFFDHGQDLFNPSLRIPLVVSFPGFLPAGERIRGAVSTLDLFPTILDLAQINFPPDLEGKSLLPLVRGTTGKLHASLFFQNDQHQMAISNGRLKLIRYPEKADAPERHELYHMHRDPKEVEDLYLDSAGRVAPLEAELSSFRVKTVAWQQRTSERRAGAPARGDSELSEEARKNLEELGYIEPSAPSEREP